MGAADEVGGVILPSRNRNVEALPDMPSPDVVLATIMRRTGATGVQSHARDFATHAARFGVKVTVVTPFEARSPLVAPVFSVRPGLSRINGDCGVWWYRQWHRHYLETALRRALRRRSGAVIYAQCPVSAAAALRVRSNQPVVMVVHFPVSQADEWAFDKGQIRPEGAVFRGIRALEQNVLPRLDGIVYVSDFMRHELETRIPSLASIRAQVIPNFVDESPHRVEDPRRDIISVGTLDRRKNHEFLIRVVAHAARGGHRYKLTVVGEGPERKALIRLASELGVDDLVELAGHHPDPRKLMASHRVYCHSSIIESFGIVLIEAMSVGLPVIAAPVGGIPEIVKPGVTGTFWSLDDEAEAARRLIMTLETPDLARRLGEAARKRFQDLYTASEVAPRLLEFLLSGASPARRPGSETCTILPN